MRLLLISFLYLPAAQLGLCARVEDPEGVVTGETLQRVLDMVGKVPEDTRQGQPVIELQEVPPTTDLGSVKPTHETVLIVSSEDK